MTLYELVRQYSEGKTFQRKRGDEWVDEPISTLSLDLLYKLLEEDKLRVRTSKQISYDVFIKSGLEVEYSSSLEATDWHVGKLDRIRGEKYFALGAMWKYCRPRIDFWCSLEGFNTALLGNLEEAGFAIEFQQFATQGGVNVVTGFKIVGLLSGFEYPWDNQ
jgi:hypothetical protein